MFVSCYTYTIAPLSRGELFSSIITGFKSDENRVDLQDVFCLERKPSTLSTLAEYVLECPPVFGNIVSKVSGPKQLNSGTFTADLQKELDYAKINR